MAWNNNIQPDSFRTAVQVPESKQKIDYSTGILAMGSCFTEHIGGRLEHYKFNIDLNPFGIVYNPLSLHHQLRYLMGDQFFTREDLFSDKGMYHSFLHHGNFSGNNADLVLEHINTRIELAREQLKHAHLLIFSLGTAWAFSLKDNGQVVSNCHKVPAAQFDRQLLTVEKIMDTLGGTLAKLLEHYPKMRILLTVSPVRHLKDGAVGNQRSKATLLMATHQLVDEHERIGYFPSYEIMNDELRDYRFYARDMAHPSDIAIDYIWHKFFQAYIDRKAHQLMQQVEDIQNAASHRPINPDSEEHRQFLKRYLVKTTQLKAAWPALDFEEEIAYFGGK